MSCRPIPDKLRKELAEKNGPLVEEGLNAFNKAIELKPNDADSMVYLNLMYRQKAEIDPDDDTRQADLKQAEDWVNKALAARKAGTASGSSEAARRLPNSPKLFCVSFRPDLSRPTRGRRQVRPLLFGPGVGSRTPNSRG